MDVNRIKQKYSYTFINIRELNLKDILKKNK